jgi:hypothetical protein
MKKILAVISLFFLASVCAFAQTSTLIVDKTITSKDDDGSLVGYTAVVHASGSTHHFSIACVSRFSDCYPLIDGDAYLTVKLNDTDSRAYPVNDSGIGSLEISTADGSKLVYFILNIPSD